MFINFSDEILIMQHDQVLSLYWAILKTPGLVREDGESDIEHLSDDDRVAFYLSYLIQGIR